MRRWSTIPGGPAVLVAGALVAGCASSGPTSASAPTATTTAAMGQSTLTTAAPSTTAAASTPTTPTTTIPVADSPDTMSSPTKVPSADGETSFTYGAPAGQNNRPIKRIIISLPGHGTSADEGYRAWSPHLDDGTYALAEFNWWHGPGEKVTDYEQPVDVVTQTRAFLAQQGYDDDDIVILHGFSRGSANTYAVIANDRLLPSPVFDAVISNAGKLQADFPLATPPPSDAEITRLFTGVPWVLACGGKDPNPDRDGCNGMAETSRFLTAHGANVLGTVSDPEGDHGAFHRSPLKLPEQAFALIEAAVG